MVDSKELAGLIQRRDQLRETVQRVKGRLDSARVELQSVEEECRKKKVVPEKIDEIITQLEQRLETEVKALTEQITLAETQVAPFLED